MDPAAAPPPELSPEQQQAMSGSGSTPTLPPDQAKSWQQAVVGAIRSKAGSPELDTQRGGAPSPTVNEAAPTVLTPVERPGFAGVVDKIGQFFAGTSNQVYIDQETGQHYVQHVPLTRGQQWAKIGAEAFRGASAGFAAGKGAGNQGKALQAGTQAQLQASQENNQSQEALAESQYQRERQQKMDKADLQMKQVQLTGAMLKNQREEVGISADLFNNYKNKLDFIKENGGEELPGEYTSSDIHQVAQAYPDFWKDHHNFANIEAVQQEDGKVKFYGLPRDWAMQPTTDADAKRGWPTFIPGDVAKGTPGHIQYDPFTPGEYSRGTYMARWNAELGKQNAELSNINKNKKEQADTQEAQAKAGVAGLMARLGVQKEQAGIAHEQAETSRAYAERDKALSDKGDGEAQAANLGEALVHNSVTEDMIPSQSKLRGQVQSYLAKKYPNLDQKSVLLTGDDRKRASLATSALENLDLIQSALKQDPKLLGKIQGRISKGRTLLGTDDQQLSAINEALDNYSIATIGAHGSRSVQMKRDAEEALLNGFKNGMDATTAAMNTARTSLHIFADKGQAKDLQGRPFNPDAPAPPAGGTGAPAAPGFNWNTQPKAQ